LTYYDVITHRCKDQYFIADGIIRQQLGPNQAA